MFRVFIVAMMVAGMAAASESDSLYWHDGTTEGDSVFLYHVVMFDTDLFVDHIDAVRFWATSDSPVTRNITVSIASSDNPNQATWSSSYPYEVSINGLTIIDIPFDELSWYSALPELGDDPFCVGITWNDVAFAMCTDTQEPNHPYNNYGGNTAGALAYLGYDWMLTCYVNGTQALTPTTWGAIKASF